jgi:hypothetical protein
VAWALAATRSRGAVLLFVAGLPASYAGVAKAACLLAGQADGPCAVVGRPTGAMEELLQAVRAVLAGRAPAGGEERALPLWCAVRRDAFMETGRLEGPGGRGPEALEALVRALRRGGKAVATWLESVPGRGVLRGTRELLARQFRLGAVGTGRAGCGLAPALHAPALAARHCECSHELAPLLLMIGVAFVGRLAGALWAALRGGSGWVDVGSALCRRESSMLTAAGNGPRPTASVVVPAYGWLEWAPLCLAALARQDFGEPYELIAVCDRESGLDRELKAEFPAVRVCYCEPRDGPGGARNAGMAAARGEYLALTDADCMPGNGWLRTVVQVCREEQRPVTGWAEPLWHTSWTDRADEMAVRGSASPARRGDAAGVSSASLCLPARPVRESGARFATGRYGAEDMALLQALPTAFRPAVLEPGAAVTHVRHDGLSGSLRRQVAVGRGSGHLRASRRMRGSFFARRPLCIPLLLPARCALTGLRCVGQGGRALLDFVRLLPLIICQLACYTRGFAAGAAAWRQEASRRPEPGERRA